MGFGRQLYQDDIFKLRLAFNSQAPIVCTECQLTLHPLWINVCELIKGKAEKWVSVDIKMTRITFCAIKVNNFSFFFFCKLQLNYYFSIIFSFSFNQNFTNEQHPALGGSKATHTIELCSSCPEAARLRVCNVSLA